MAQRNNPLQKATKGGQTPVGALATLQSVN